MLRFPSFNFIVLIIHLTLIILVYSSYLSYSHNSNIRPYFAENEIVANVTLSILCITIEIIITISGFNIFHQHAIFMSIVLHSIASILLLCSVVDLWSTTALWNIWVFLTLFPSLVQVGYAIQFIRGRRITY